MSEKSKTEYLESCRARYPGRNREGKSLLIDEMSDTMGWTRKHTIKALNGKVTLGKKALKRGSKPRCNDSEQAVIIVIWKHSEQPCGVRLKETLPLWLDSYEKHHGKLSKSSRTKILSLSGRSLDRITAAHRATGEARWKGRKTGRTSHRLKTLIPIQCGPQEVDRPGWMEADTVSHGGGSSSGEFMWSLTLTDLHTGWTELAALWGNSGSEVRVGLERIEKRMPFDLLGFDSDNGSEFLNSVLEHYLLGRKKSVKWTRSRAYKKNDQAHVEQKNFTHVRQLLGYGRIAELEVRDLVTDLYESTWLPLRNNFTPVMKLVEKTREGSKVRKKYDAPATPCDRLLSCPKVSESRKKKLRATRARLDPMELSEELEKRLGEIFQRVEKIERERAEEEDWLGEQEEQVPHGATVATGSVPATVATAPCASTPPVATERLVKSKQKKEKKDIRRVS